MWNTAQSVAMVVASMIAAQALLLVTRRYWPQDSRRVHNDTIGWHVGVIGTTYAVILAFMLSGVWNDFQAAAANAEVEANSLVNVFRLAQGLPVPVRDRIQALARQYAEVMLTDEWPAMNQGKLSPVSVRITQELWDSAISVGSSSALELTSLNRLFAELSAMTEHRRIRQAQSQSELPGLLWAVLVIGGLITVGYSCLFGIHDIALHSLQVATLSLLVSLVLVAIADIDQPFRGSVHVSSHAFQLALDTFSANFPARGR